MENATITRIDHRTGSTPGGTVAYDTGAAIAVRCFVDSPKGEDKITVQSREIHYTQMLYVRQSVLAAAGVAFETDDRLLVKLDGHDAPGSFLVRYRLERTKGTGTDHYQAFLMAE